MKRLFQIVGLKVIKILDPNKELKNNDYELESVSICRKLITKDDSVLLISPISGKRYIKSEDNQLFLILERYQLTIVNHAYSYNINVEGKAFDKIANMFDNEVERRREIMENEIRSNVKHSLKEIYNNLVHEQVQKN